MSGLGARLSIAYRASRARQLKFFVGLPLESRYADIV
jgi:hypothetical protein